MPESSQLNVEVLLSSKDAREFANKLGSALTQSTKEWTDDVKSKLGKGLQAATLHAFGSGQTGSAVQSFVKSNLTAVYADFHKAIQKSDAEAAQRHSDLLDKRLRKYERELNARAQAHARVVSLEGKSFAEKTDAFRRVSDSVRRGPAATLEGLIRGTGRVGEMVGGHLQFQATERGARAKKMRDPAAAKSAARLGKIGSAIAKLGTAAMAIGAVAGAVVMLVKLFADLESKIKDMNKSLMEGAGAADFGLTPAEIRAGHLTEELEKLRNETTSVNENFRKFRIAAKDQQQLLAVLNRTGFTYARMNEEVKKGNELIKSRSDVTAIAITYARNLGLTTTEVGESMGKFIFETGAGLTDIAEGFSIIQREATVAGFVTKRFYSTVVEVTSGLNFYGVRLEETTKMLKTFDALLGEAAGMEAFKRIAGRGAETSFEASLREFIVKDPEFVTEQYGRAFRQKLAIASREFAKKGINVKDLLGRATSERDLYKILARPEYKEKGVTGQEATNLGMLYRLQQAQEPSNTAAQLAARGAAGPGFEAAMAVRAMTALGAGESLADVYETAQDEQNATLLLAMEKIAQTTGKPLDHLVVLSQKASAEFAYLKELAETGQEMPEYYKRMGYYFNEQRELMKGVAHETEKGAIYIAKEGAEAIESQFAYIATQPTEDAELLVEQLNRDQQIAKEISREMTGLNDLMEQSVAMILNQIYGVLTTIADFLFKDDPERAAELRLQEQMAKESAEAAESLRKLRDEEKFLRAKAERGEELTKEEQATLEGLPRKIAKAADESQIARDAAVLAKDTPGEQILEGFQEARRKTRARAGAEWEATGAAKESAQKIDELTDSWLPSWNEFIGSWGRSASNVTAAGLPRGKRLGAAVERGVTGLGLAGEYEEIKARGKRFLGVEGYAELTDEDIQKIGESTQAAAENYWQGREVWRDYAGAGLISAQYEREAARQEAIGTALQQQRDDQRQADEEAGEQRSKMLEALKASAAAKWADLQKAATQTKDLILPAGGGKPLITDERDTLFAARPDGPIAAALSGGRGGAVTVNIYGGDQSKVYDTVMRVLKATGNA